ncbi:ABC transporter ATP-binding protein [Veronia nyctiphanis]|nr:ABC transporter ATP-binding protein [Veronia nyctiphanis]
MPAINVIFSIELVDTMTSGEAVSFVLIFCWALTFSLPHILAPINSVLQGTLNDKVTRNVQVSIIEMMSNIKDLGTLHDEKLHDTIELLSKESSHRPLNTLVNLVDIFRGFITLSSLAFILSMFTWWLPLLLLAPMLPVGLAMRNAQTKVYKVMLSSGKEPRFFKYFFQTVLSPKNAEDIRLYNLFPFFSQKYQHHYDRYLSAMKGKRLGAALTPQPWNLLYLLCLTGTVYWLSLGATSSVTGGQMVGLIQSLAIFGATSQAITWSFSALTACVEYFRHMKSLSEITPSIDVSKSALPLPNDKTIVFDNVSFSYPDGRCALSNISLTIAAGEKVALVGENGAGKTTLVKLLCRFYDPTEGRITVGGNDLKRLNLDEWRAYIGALFQDFGRYNLTVGENISLGHSQGDVNEEQLRGAAEKARFSLETLNLSSQLGTEFGGTNLSGGQWQRLALARTVNRKCGLVMLDEPTSAMDPRVEAELFEQFTSIMTDRTALMVTHRLGSVALLERVLVLKSGKLIEDGSPAYLESIGGEYAQLWKLQSEQYKKQPEAV